MVSAADLILVAVLNNRRDFEIARVLGWYRIPVKSAPKTLLVDYLAFYQTARFGDEKWAINYCAPVKGHELATRRELLRTEPDHPRAQEQYYKVQIGPLERLPRPIPSRRWRRLTFLYTTGKHLLEAQDVGELAVHSAERAMLWRALRERGLLLPQAAQEHSTTDAPELDFRLLCALGNLGIVVGEAPKQAREPGWRVLAFPEERVHSELEACAAEVAKAVEQMGGLKRSWS